MFSVEESDIAEPEMEQEADVFPKQKTSLATVRRCKLDPSLTLA